jgi:cephalosporin hydroxylase
VKLTIDEDAGTLLIHDPAGTREVQLYSTRGFELLSGVWTKVGWNQKHLYTFSWMGRPIIQLPDDMIRIQELVWSLQPEVIVETGVAHGGSLVFYASLCQVIGKGRVVGVDIEIRPHNRIAIDAHPQRPRIELIEGSSVAPEIVSQVRAHCEGNSPVLVILDSDHSRTHVRAELEQYAPLVTPGSYIVATDGIQRDLSRVPRGKPDWDTNNPVSAVEDFLRDHAEFELAPPAWPFNESELAEPVTHWPSAYLKRKA